MLPERQNIHHAGHVKTNILFTFVYFLHPSPLHSSNTSCSLRVRDHVLYCHLRWCLSLQSVTILSIQCMYVLQTTLHLIEDHHAEVDEVVTTSQEIVSLCSDLYDASPVVQLASDLSAQFESRKQTVRRRLDDLEAFFRQIFSNVNILLNTINFYLPLSAV